jgi:hypothetical protein
VCTHRYVCEKNLDITGMFLLLCYNNFTMGVFVFLRLPFYFKR